MRKTSQARGSRSGLADFCTDLAASKKSVPGQLFFFGNCWHRDSLAEATRDARELEQKLQTLDASRQVLREEQASAAPWLRMRRLNDEQQLYERMLNPKLELSRIRSELPHASQGTVAGPGQLTLAREGLVCVKRRRSGAPFGWMKLPLPWPRTVFEAIGTFELRPL